MQARCGASRQPGREAPHKRCCAKEGTSSLHVIRMAQDVCPQFHVFIGRTKVIVGFGSRCFDCLFCFLGYVCTQLPEKVLVSTDLATSTEEQMCDAAVPLEAEADQLSGAAAGVQQRGLVLLPQVPLSLVRQRRALFLRRLLSLPIARLLSRNRPSAAGPLPQRRRGRRVPMPRPSSRQTRPHPLASPQPQLLRLSRRL